MRSTRAISLVQHKLRLVTNYSHRVIIIISPAHFQPRGVGRKGRGLRDYVRSTRTYFLQPARR